MTPEFKKIRFNNTSSEYNWLSSKHISPFYFTWSTIWNFTLQSDAYDTKNYTCIEEAFEDGKHFIETTDRIPDQYKNDCWVNAQTRILTGLLIEKFLQNDSLIPLILATNTDYLEYDIADDYWGCGVNGQGLNLYGVCLMRARDKIKQILKESN